MSITADESANERPDRGAFAPWRPTAVLSRLLGITRGEAATLVIALGVAVVLAVAGLVPVLRHRPSGDPVASPTPASGRSPVAAPSGDVPAAPVVPAPLNTGVRPTFAPEASTGDATAFSDTTGTTSSGPTPPATGELGTFAEVGSPGAPDGVAVDRDGTVYVATNNGTTQGERGASRILTFDPSGKAGRSYSISGQPDDHALGLTGLVLDGDGGIIALDAATGRILRVSRSTGAQAEYSTLFDLPACQLVVAAVNGCEPGVGDDLPVPRSAAFDSAGNLFVTDSAQGTVWKVPAGGGKAEAWFSDASFGGEGVTGIALAADGALLVASPQALDPAARGGGAVYRIVVQDGKPGAKTLLTSFPRGDSPFGIATLSDGSFVVALRGANAVALIGRDGSEVRRVQGRAGGVAMDAPTGLAFHGNVLLVTNQAPATKANWSVLTAGVV
jgi:sugar lactone lactonase YvrE